MFANFTVCCRPNRKMFTIAASAIISVNFATLLSQTAWV